ncbi:deoxyribonuclease IV [Neobacillus notoginsengisoli]|uniref:Deoxyribonuclease IV n=1 Tax=Neobacillus notoginsengisoli TaxID=1578198 RepID=A0A417YWR6_9BACI|nr:deoxyribonuclease IV [Neobacillus notoginsengisoli]RHW42033.1 deoxyribonuclease IV [Neobacillus notoginsengisoli]
MTFGCHVSIRDGYLAAAKYANKIGAQAFQYFPKNARSLSVKEFDKNDAAACREFCHTNSLFTIAHTPYPTSITPPPAKKEINIASILNDLAIADACGSAGIVVHFGSRTAENAPLASYHLMLEMLNTILSQWDGDCLLLLENNAGKEAALGTTLEESVQVRNLCEYPEKIGFCLDTCHAFASGMWNGEDTYVFKQKAVELGYAANLTAIHLNNSMHPFGSRRDRHANIYKGGHIMPKQMESIIAAFSDIPFILETPSDLGISHEEEMTTLKRLDRLPPAKTT